MTLDQYRAQCEKTIAAKFRVRNTAVFGDSRRQTLLVQGRRLSILKWVRRLRVARDPSGSESIKNAVSWMVA